MRNQLILSYSFFFSILNRRLTSRLFLCIALILVGGCAGTVTRETVSVKVEVLDSLKRYTKEHVLQQGDIVEIFVYKHADFSRTTKIRPDGKITLPLLDDIQAAGKTPAALDAELTALYAERIIDPEVTVIVENAEESVVYVVGEVGAPSAIPYRQAKTVAQAVARSGGVSKSGVLKHVSVIRLNEQGFFEAQSVIGTRYNQPEMYMALHNIALLPDDLIIIPESYRSQFVRILRDMNTILSPYYQFRVLKLIDD